MAVYVWAGLSASVIFIRVDKITYFLQSRIIGCQACHQHAWEFFEGQKLKESVFKSSVDGLFVTFVESIRGFEGVAVFYSALEGPASSANLTLEKIACLILCSVSSLE